MYLARAHALKRPSMAVGGCPTASRSASKLLSVGKGRLSSSLARQVGAVPTARASGGLLATAAHGPGKGLVEARRARLMMKDQQTRSLGLFSGGGGVSHQRLKELEKMAAQSPTDANAEVCRDTNCCCRAGGKILCLKPRVPNFVSVLVCFVGCCRDIQTPRWCCCDDVSIETSGLFVDVDLLRCTQVIH